MCDKQIDKSPDTLSKPDPRSAVFEAKPQVKGKAKVRCCVPGCKSRRDKNRNLSFHSWPKKGAVQVKVANTLGIEQDVDSQSIWMQRLKMGKKCTEAMRVCSLHFSKGDFLFEGAGCKRKVLKKNAVPSVCLPATPVHGTVRSTNKRDSPGISTARAQRYRRRLNFRPSNEVKVAHENLPNLELVDGGDGNVVSNGEPTFQSTNGDGSHRTSEPENLEQEAVAALLLLSSRPGKEDKGIQCNNVDTISPFASIIKSDSILNTLTGIPSLQILDGLVGIMHRTFPKSATNKYILTAKERIVLTMLKIKQDLSYVVLAALFQNISRQSCSRIFKNTVVMLEQILSPLLRWPSREEINENMPSCFQRYSSTRIILDCTEIAVEKPKCLRCRIRCYSQYKSDFTLKFLTGVTPAGVTTYVSPAYGGRASDKHIFLESGLLNKLTGGVDAIMADKGFLIESECAFHNIKLLQPPFLRGEKQFSKDRALFNRDVAAARVHIERVNQRLKIFRILRNRFPWALVGYANHIFNIACALVNLSKPILSDERF